MVIEAALMERDQQPNNGDFNRRFQEYRANLDTQENDINQALRPLQQRLNAVREQREFLSAYDQYFQNPHDIERREATLRQARDYERLLRQSLAFDPDLTAQIDTLVQNINQRLSEVERLNPRHDPRLQAWTALGNLIQGQEAVSGGGHRTDVSGNPISPARQEVARLQNELDAMNEQINNTPRDQQNRVLLTQLRRRRDELDQQLHAANRIAIREDQLRQQEQAQRRDDIVRPEDVDPRLRGGGNGRRPPAAPPAAGEQPAPEPQRQERMFRAEQIFEPVDPATFDRNHPYFIENPTEQIALDARQMLALESTAPAYIIEQRNGRPVAIPNPALYPFLSENAIINSSRFRDFLRITNGEPSLLALSAVSSDTAEKQGRLYKALMDVVLKIHENNPGLLGRWVNAQGDPQQAQPSSILRLLQNDHEGGHLIADENRRMLTIGNGDLAGAWQRRIQELRQAINNNQFNPYHLQWLEFLTKSVNIQELLNMTKIQSEQAAPPGGAPQPTPPAAAARPQPRSEAELLQANPELRNRQQRMNDARDAYNRALRENIPSRDKGFMENLRLSLGGLFPGRYNPRQRVEEARRNYINARNDYYNNLGLAEARSYEDFDAINDEEYRRRLADRVNTRVLEDEDRLLREDIERSQQHWLLTPMREYYHQHAGAINAALLAANLGLAIAFPFGTVPAAAYWTLFAARGAAQSIGFEGVIHNRQIENRDREAVDSALRGIPENLPDDLDARIQAIDALNLTPRERARRLAIIEHYRDRNNIADADFRARNERLYLTEEALRQKYIRDQRDPIIRDNRIAKDLDEAETMRFLHGTRNADVYNYYHDAVQAENERIQRDRVGRYVGATALGFGTTVLFNWLGNEIRNADVNVTGIGIGDSGAEIDATGGDSIEPLPGSGGPPLPPGGESSLPGADSLGTDSGETGIVQTGRAYPINPGDTEIVQTGRAEPIVTSSAAPSFETANYQFINPDREMLETIGSANDSSLIGRAQYDLGKYYFGREWNIYGVQDLNAYHNVINSNPDLHSRRLNAILDFYSSHNSFALSDADPKLIQHFVNGEGYHNLTTGRSVGTFNNFRILTANGLNQLMNTVR